MDGRRTASRGHRQEAPSRAFTHFGSDGPKRESVLVRLRKPSWPATRPRRCFQDQIEQFLLQSSHASTHEIFSIKLALEEALINAIKHGNQMDSTRKCASLYRVAPGFFEVRVVDEGPGFDPSDVPDPRPSKISNGPAAAASCSCATT